MKKTLIIMLLSTGLFACKKDCPVPETPDCPTFILPYEVKSLDTGKPEWIGRAPVYDSNGALLYVGYIYREKC